MIYMTSESLRRFVAILMVSVASSMSAETLVVTNISDLVNGDTRSSSALIANPGPDGISLREAIEAANSGGGAVRITFDLSLAGKTISIAMPLELRRDHITIEGPASPVVTIEGSAIPFIFQQLEQAMIYVLASDIRIAHLRFIAIRHFAVEVRVGGQLPPAGPLAIHDVVIDGNEFDNRGFTTPDPYPSAIRVWDAGRDGGVGTSLRRVSIVNNHIVGLQDVGIIGQPSGINNVLEDFLIGGNTIEQTPFPIEVSLRSGDHDDAIRRTRIMNNRVVGATVSIVVATGLADGRVQPGNANVVEDTVISDNIVIGAFDSIDVAAALVPQGSGPGATGNILRNTVIRNNLIAAGKGIEITGGGAGSLNNVVDGVAITNNTIVTTPRAGVSVMTNVDGGSGNVVKNLTIQNSIFVGPVKDQSGPEDEISGDITPDQVLFSITQAPKFIGVNGNFSADPRFVNAAARDYHLAATSPAIGRADPAVVPSADLDCRARDASPDIGAYESGAPATNRLTLVLRGAGTATTAPAGLHCGSSLGFPASTSIRLLASPSPGAVFTGWEGDHDCNTGILTLSVDSTCIATFASVKRRAARH